MQTKRQQTLLAGAGLLTALTLTLAGCTPSKFTLGPGAPTQANTPSAPAATLSTLSGKADFLGTPLANADLKITDLKTGKIIATGGGNLKTDANGAFSVEVPGMSENDVVRIDVTNADGTVSALMTGDGLTTDGDAPAGYTVADASGPLYLQVNVISTLQAQLFTPMLRTHVRAQVNFRPFIGEMNRLSPLFHRFANDSQNSVILGRAFKIGPYTGSDETDGDGTLQEITEKSGVASILKETLTKAFKQVAKVDVKVAQSFNGKPLSPGLKDSVVKIEGNSVTLNGETFNLDNGGTNNGGQENPTDNPSPTTEVTQDTKTEVQDPKGEWVNDGNMSPTVTIGTSSVTVAQDANEVQMVAMTMLLPKANVSGASIAQLSGANLNGTVTGTTRSGVARSGDLTFSALDGTGKGTITLGTFGQIGTYTVTDEGGTWKITMTYTFNESGIELVGAHTTTVNAPSVSLTKKDGLAIVIAGAGASSRIQY